MSKKLIEVEFISRSVNCLTVHFNNEAVQLFDYEMQPLSGVIVNERELQAERYTKKYNEAVEAYLSERTEVIDNEGENGVFHKVYMVGEIVTACKYHDKEMVKPVQVYDWSNHYKTNYDLIKSTIGSGHQQYTFIEVLSVDNEALGRALEVEKSLSSVIGLNLSEGAKNNLVGILKRYFLEFKNTFSNRLIVDAENNLHFIFETVEDFTSEYHVHRYIFQTNDKFLPNYRGSFSEYSKAENMVNKNVRGFLERINF